MTKFGIRGPFVIRKDPPLITIIFFKFKYVNFFI